MISERNIDLLYSKSIEEIDKYNKLISSGIRLSDAESDNLSFYVSAFPYLKKYNDLKNDLNYAESTPSLQNTDFIPSLKKEFEDVVDHINFLINEKNNIYISEFLIELRAGAGGQEASLFVKDIYNAYTKFLSNNKYGFELIEVSESDTSGYSAVTFEVHSSKAYEVLKNEGGVHRVQRVPRTESSGRIHTSTISVAILPLDKAKDIEILPKDIRIDVYRSSGHGGQSVNTTDSAVRITHIPSGLVVTSQNTKSQIKNKELALKVLQARLQDIEEKTTSNSINSIRNKQILNSDRSEKIRTYNYLQDRITDHRVKLDFSGIEKFMQGDIERVIIPINNQLAILSDSSEE